ncbi:MAG: hypothetical protein A3F83_16480 [Candidatus Glassbacteria bacterium RIFCSPLOWO2_12_FULL_58_11]|uniref:Phosphohistidine phosphatase SixA n=1 Tax=Candidatus Glassbacteria bacterium RIFCSPLOWO2_12_FULL_58_11 TaxID=1817867 RepID=A0A1F5Z2Q8_9BACT|nr:MAG: hypothetical protein A3F83_16480 [Candidatus Glassbacteria bacterium RIFCSPLOWO2_12_FULL_58_11]
MKTLYLVRHAKGESRFGQKPDFQRSITERGREDALKVAESLKATEKSPSVIISSPALRARQTANIFAGQLGYRTKAVRTRKILYDQDGRVILAMLQGLDPALERVMLVGHNPSLSDLAKKFCDEIRDDLPTSGAVAIEFEVRDWPSIGKVKGVLKLYEFPKAAVKCALVEKKPGLKKSIETKLIQQISLILEEQDRTAAEKMRGPIRSLTKKLVKKFVAGMAHGKGGN